MFRIYDRAQRAHSRTHTKSQHAYSQFGFVSTQESDIIRF